MKLLAISIVIAWFVGWTFTMSYIWFSNPNYGLRKRRTKPQTNSSPNINC